MSVAIHQRKVEQSFLDFCAARREVDGEIRRRAELAMLNHIDGCDTGLHWGHNVDLLLVCVRRSYETLEQSCDLKDFVTNFAQVIQEFASLKHFRQRELCFPHFLLHGIYHASDQEAVMGKIRANIRIIDETLDVRKEWRARNEFRPRALNDLPLRLMISSGSCDDMFGIAYDLEVLGIYRRLANLSIMVDRTMQEAYVITFQGPRWYDLNPGESASKMNMLSQWLTKDPRALTLDYIIRDLQGEGVRKLYAILPTEHLYYLEKHRGYTARYLPQLRKCGFTRQEACYLVREIPSLGNASSLCNLKVAV
jgi:hypothetical protein